MFDTVSVKLVRGALVDGRWCEPGEVVDLPAELADVYFESGTARYASPLRPTPTPDEVRAKREKATNWKGGGR